MELETARNVEPYFQFIFDPTPAGKFSILKAVKKLKLFRKTLAKVRTGKGAGNAYKIAQAGGKHTGFLKNYAGKSPAQIKKAINSYQKATNVHLDKIANPSKYVPNWNTLRSGHQQSLIRGWRSEVTNSGEQIQILQGILR